MESHYPDRFVRSSYEKDWFFQKIAECFQKHSNLVFINKENYTIDIVSRNQHTIVAVVRCIEGPAYVFRLNLLKNREEHFVRAYEYTLASDSVPSKPLVLDASHSIFPHTYIITTYVDGKVMDSWNRSLLTKHSKSLASLHTNAIDHCRFFGGDKRNFLSIYTLYNDCVNFWRRKNCPAFSNSKIIRIDNYISSYFKNVDRYFLGLKQFSLVHGDAHSGNIIVHNGMPMLIDWEWAYAGDPAADIANLIWPIKTSRQVCLNKIQSDAFFDTYFTIRNDGKIRERVSAWVLFIMFFELIQNPPYGGDLFYEHGAEKEERLIRSDQIFQYLSSLA